MTDLSSSMDKISSDLLTSVSETLLPWWRSDQVDILQEQTECDPQYDLD